MLKNEFNVNRLITERKNGDPSGGPDPIERAAGIGSGVLALASIADTYHGGDLGVSLNEMATSEASMAGAGYLAVGAAVVRMPVSHEFAAGDTAAGMEGAMDAGGAGSDGAAGGSEGAGGE